MLGNLFSFICAIPDLIKLYSSIRKGIEDSERESKVKEDLKNIKKALDEKDIDKINYIFNSN